MKVFKFGGSSLKNSKGICQMLNILLNYKNEKFVLVVSALGKTTNYLEDVLRNVYANKKYDLKKIIDFHYKIINELFEDPIYVHDKINYHFMELNQLFKNLKFKNYSFDYDQIVSKGEIISSIIIYEFLKNNNFKINWISAKKLIKTNSNFQSASVLNSLSEESIKKNIDKNTSIITQGFIGCSENNFTTTLGREGSDYTASIIASSLNVKKLTIWKDVPGVLTADPKYFEKFNKIDFLSYEDAFEIAFYGSSIIHQKTIIPLEKKNIKLEVKSFNNPGEKGTVICNYKNQKKIKFHNIKKNQISILFKKKSEDILNDLDIKYFFSILSKLNIQLNQIKILPKSLICFTENDIFKMDKLLSILNLKFSIIINKNLSILTIKNFDKKDIQKYSKKNQIFSQITLDCYQIIYRD